MSENSSSASVLAILEGATQSPENSILGSQVLPELEGWDSMGMVMFIGMVKQKRAVELTVHELRDCRTVAELESLVIQKGNS